MSRAGFAFAHARMQARFSERLDELDWQRLESSRNLAHCLEVASRTEAAELTSRLTPASTAHQIERTLRQEWQEHVEEVSGWLPPKWRGACRCMTSLPYLVRPAFLSSGEPLPEWLALDPDLPRYRAEARPTGARGQDVAAGWLEAWRRLLPDGRAFAPLCAALEPLLTRYLGGETRGPAGPASSSADCMVRLRRVFRSALQSPEAAFAYLGMAALDFERLRGVLVCRTLFPEIPGEA